MQHRNAEPYEYDSECPALRTFDNDGEGCGNPHPLRDEIEIGCDEHQMLIVPGSWTGDSIAHDDNSYPSAILQPSALSSGTSQRHLTPHQRYAGYPLTVNGTLTSPSAVGPGWTQPPGTPTNPTLDPSAGFEHRRRYIPYNANPVPPPATNPTMPWTVAALTLIPVPLNYIGVPNWPGTQFAQFIQSESKCQGGACGHAYFTMQGVIEGYPVAGSRHHANLQNDYR